ncbi:ATP-binding cassette subfamily F protein 3 [Virgibacillus natechei]|uniref:ATP-binding cassette subfamily F protein 3 n=1 Tax=Virgibacillus natechei TaxID=1216297 RepID=A0ABS4IMK5_9BACI|nr:ABC-F family ATP-binding cassette domain-containing protein [Virgibacillus natechei]MBP1971666.1 ATP-binding cassette subfamily F protein 3 [Virgibacillus natechei]UZD13847.1 ABC-F family ATP-binding cassette domain-containing protein [Virgibacillus natechei]
MILMQLNNLTKSFGADEILANVKLEIKDNDRIAIVGRNGSGKSTLLKIMAGELNYDDGDLFRPKDLTIGYLSQHTSLASEKTIWDEMVEVFHHLTIQEQDLRALEKEMEQASGMSSAHNEKILQDYDKLQQSFHTNGGYTYEADIKAVLSGLHFQDYDYGTPINELSGGQKTRLALGKLLLKKPELLILDEPTNHLDIDTLGWLENYLISYPGAVIIVSHDRYFLDKTVSIVYEISRHITKKYHGSYSKFLEQKALDYEQELKDFEKQQTEMKKMEDFVQRNIARASTTKRAQSRRKQLEKMDKLDKPLGDESSANFSFQINRRSGNDVLKMDNLSFRYEDESEPLFTNAKLNVNRGERIALVGPNGVGKTTLLKLILEKFKPITGTIKLGTNVQIGYYDQEQANLSSSKTVLLELWDDYPTVNEKDIRTVLGNFLFSGDDVLKYVHSLSGGEKARLALAKLMMQKANLLIMDEPTNHLDIDSKEVLEAALIDFPGTIIFVSHDRYFINKLADQVAHMQQDGVTIYLGDYDYYIEKRAEEAEIARLKQVESEKVEQKNEPKKRSHKEEKQLQSERRKQQRRITELEETIEKREGEIAELEEKMTQPEIYQDHEKALELTTKTNELKQDIEHLMEEWATLQED